MMIKIVKFVAFVLFFAFIVEYFGSKGLIGVLFLVLSISLYRIWTNREKFMIDIRMIETQFFGKSLDKENWENEQVKIPKFVKGKKDDTERTSK